MADAVALDPSAPDGETPTQRQARLRREKRQKKMSEQGEDRLARIKALNGGVAPPEEVLGGPKTGPKAATVEDPDEVDIDTISGTGTPRTNLRNGQVPNDPLAAAISQMQQQQGQQQQGAPDSEDPMVRMMQQLSGMMGGQGGDPNDPNSAQELPAMLKALMNGGGQATADEQKAPEKDSTYIWRITHAIFAFTLAVYITMTSTFNGSKLARSQDVYAEKTGYGFGSRLFYIFVTAELLLQSTRYFIEKGELQGPGILAKIANSGFVPPPYAQYIRTLGRYISIFQTILADAMVIIFTFGALAWWQGLAT